MKYFSHMVHVHQTGTQIEKGEITLIKMMFELFVYSQLKDNCNRFSHHSDDFRCTAEWNVFDVISN